MPIRVDCLTCRKWYKAPDKVAGSVVKCPGCGGELKVPLGCSPAPATSKPSTSASKPDADLPPLDDDDPFAAAGFPPPDSVLAGSGSGSGAVAPPPAVHPRPSTKSSGGIGQISVQVFDWVVDHPLVIAVSVMATLLLIVGLATGGRTLAAAGIGAIVGGGIAALGLVFPDRPRPRKRQTQRVSDIMSPKLIGGISVALLVVVWEVGSALWRHASRLEAAGETVTGGAMAGAMGRVLGGVGALMAVCMALSGAMIASIHFGLFRVLAPIYLAAAAILLVAGVPDGSGPWNPMAAIGTTDAAGRNPLAPINHGKIAPILTRGQIDAGFFRRTVVTSAPKESRELGGMFNLVLPTASPAPDRTRSRPCVIIAPPGSDLLSGVFSDKEGKAEALHWAAAGYVVIVLDVVTGAMVKKTDPDYQRQAYDSFRRRRAGLSDVENALAFIQQEMPQVDPERVAIAGKGSGGTLALLAAESNPAIKACVAFSPCVDVALLRKDDMPTIASSLPGVANFCSEFSPISHVDRVRCPLFVFQAEDDAVMPLAETVRFVDAAKDKQKVVEFVRIPTGGHDQAVVDEGIPRAIQWLNATFARATAPRPTAPE